MLLGNVLDIGTPSDGTISTAKIVDDAVTSAKTDFFNADTSAADIGTGLHVKTGDSGHGAETHADELVIENDANGGLTLAMGNSNSATIAFANTNSNEDGKIVYRNSERELRFNTAGSERLRINSSGKALFNTTTSDNGMVISNGTDTTGDNACYGLERGSYKATIGMTSGGGMTLKNFAGEINVIDSADNSTTISPHNFSVIPNGVSEDLAWSYYSRKGDEENDFDNTKYISADIAKVIRKVENLTGDKLIYTGIGNTDDGSTVSQNIIQSLIDRIETLEAKVTTLETE
jgi:hypothetical protein